MIDFAVLDAAQESQRRQWISLWEQGLDKDPNAHPAYAELFATSADRVVCATLTDADGVVLFPLIVRELHSQPWAYGLEPVCDLVSPYGYGGPFACGHPDAASFWSYFTEWTQSIHAVSCFARLSLFPQQQIPFSGQVEAVSSNIVRSLTLSTEELWRDYEYKVRKNVNKAQRNGLSVVIDASGERLDDFLHIYYTTMQRREASARYYFSPAFFKTLIDHLPGSFAFFHCLSAEQIISTELVLASATTAYSFLGGTLPEAFELRPNDLLKHTITLWAKESGRQNFVLGGGYTNDDGIFRYKKSFAPNGIVPFNVGKRIENAAQYKQLVMLRRSWELEHSGDWQPDEHFFPAYRA